MVRRFLGIASLALLALVICISARAARAEMLTEPYKAPEFVGVSNWLNSDPLTLAELRGKVVLIDFWTYSCINCLRTLPFINAWDKDYRDKGLVIIGVHAPEFDFEKNLDNIKTAVAKHHINYPVAVDNALHTWDAYRNRFWPAHYLIDKEGRVVYTHFGEGKYEETENVIRTLLGLGKKATAGPEPVAFALKQTPETYLGNERAENFASPEKLSPETESFTFPETLPISHWALSGAWRVEPQRIISADKNASLRLHFSATNVFLVMGTQNKAPIHVKILLDGQVQKSLIVDQHRLYTVISKHLPKTGLLQLTADAPGLEAYAFTFGE